MKRTETATWLVKVGCYTFCLTLPISNLFNDISIGLVLIGCLLEGQWDKRWMKWRSRYLLLPLCFYLLHVVGLIYTSDLIEAGKHLETKSAILLLPLTLGTTGLLSEFSFRKVLKTFVWTNLAVAVYCFIVAFLRYREKADLEYFYYHRLTEVIDLHAIYFALYLGISVLIILYFELFAKPLFPRLLSYILVFLFLVSIIFLSALVVIFVLPILIFYMLTLQYLQGWSKAMRVSAFAGCLVIFLLVASALPYTRTKLRGLTRLEYHMGDEDYKWGSLTIRLAKWECAMKIIRSNWFFGVGTGDGQNELMVSYREKGFREGLRNNYNTHNQYLETWIMLGVPGLVLLLAMLYPAGKGPLWGSFLVLMAISFLTENMFDTQKGVVFFSFFYALLPPNLLAWKSG